MTAKVDCLAAPGFGRGGSAALARDAEGPASAALEFRAVYAEHFDYVWRSLRLLGVADDAVEDAIQDTFSVVLRQLDRFEGRSSLKTWLFAILHRVAANHRRAYKRKREKLERFDELMAEGPAPDEHAEAVEVARLVERFCARLEPERRALFVLAVLEEAPAAEVAATLGIAVTQVYSRVHTLREGLRRMIAEWEVQRG